MDDQWKNIEKNICHKHFWTEEMDEDCEYVACEETTEEEEKY